MDPLPLRATTNVYSAPGFTAPVADPVWVRITGGTPQDRVDAAGRAVEAACETEAQWGP